MHTRTKYVIFGCLVVFLLLIIIVVFLNSANPLLKIEQSDINSIQVKTYAKLGGQATIHKLDNTQFHEFLSLLDPGVHIRFPAKYSWFFDAEIVMKDETNCYNIDFYENYQGGPMIYSINGSYYRGSGSLADYERLMKSSSVLQKPPIIDNEAEQEHN